MHALNAPASSSRFVKWREPLISFLIGQPAVQLLNLITGFLLLRWLDVEQYAMLGITLAFQSTVIQLTDVGFSSSVVALAGSRGKDPEVLGSYLRSARHWRSRLLGLVLFLAVIVFPFLTWSQPWSPATKCLLFATVTLSALFQSWTMYGSPLLVHRALGKYYRPQIVAALFRLAASGLLYSAALLQAWVAALLSALALGYVGKSYRRSARLYIKEPVVSNPEKNREMRRYLSPLFPGVIFAILQGPILIALSAVFGTTQNLAEVSALGRLGQLFLILGAFVSVFIEPYIASVPRPLLLRRYFQILAVAIFIAAAIGTAGFLIPTPFLWLLGPKYSGLQIEVAWVLLSSSLAFLGGVLWAMHAARRWVFWWGSFAYIGVMVTTQAICLTTMDLSQTLQVILFGVISCAATLLVHFATGLYGFNRVRTAR